MFVNQGRNRGILFISRSTVSFPSPTGIMLVGTKLVGVKVNIPYLELNFSNQGLSTDDVDAILVHIDNTHDTELTWRVIDLTGNEPITDQTTYDVLLTKGFEIYGETDFGAFIMEIETTLASEEITLPISEGVFIANVNWGDGNIDSLDSHTYTNAGVYTISITGIMESFNTSLPVNIQPYLIKIIDWGLTGLTYFSLRGCVNCIEMATDTKGSFANVTLLATMLRDNGIQVVPQGFLDYAVNITRLYRVFQYCGVTSYPNGLFNNIPNSNSYAQSFQSAKAPTLLNNNWQMTKVLRTGSMFSGALFTTIDFTGWSSAVNNDYSNFLINVYLDTPSYDQFLTEITGWNAGVPTKTVLSGGTFTANYCKYTLGSDAEAARNWLITNNGWAITDNGGI